MATKEYKVLYDDKWEVHSDDGQKVGYEAWDQRVALSYAKDTAKKNRPSKIVVHDKTGQATKEIEYPPKGSAVEIKD
jgi:hypothetical protein